MKNYKILIAPSSGSDVGLMRETIVQSLIQPEAHLEPITSTVFHNLGCLLEVAEVRLHITEVQMKNFPPFRIKAYLFY